MPYPLKVRNYEQQIPALSEHITILLQNKFQKSVARINSPLLLVIVILKQLTFPSHLYFCKYSCTGLSDHFQAFQWNAFLHYNRPFSAPWLDPLHRIGFPGRKNACQDLSGSHLCKKKEKSTIQWSTVFIYKVDDIGRGFQSPEPEARVKNVKNVLILKATELHA